MFIEFTDDDKELFFINPKLIIYIRELGSNRSLLALVGNKELIIEEPIKEVYARIKKHTSRTLI